MKELLLAHGRRMLKSLLAGALVAAVSLVGAGKAGLLGAFFIGYAAAALCSWMLVWRTWRSSGLDVVRAKKQMWIGLAMRLFTMFIVFWVAIQLSVEVFWSVVSGFVLFSVIAMLHLIWFSYACADKK